MTDKKCPKCGGSDFYEKSRLCKDCTKMERNSRYDLSKRRVTGLSGGNKRS